MTKRPLAVKVPTRRATVEARARNVTAVYPPILVPWRDPNVLKTQPPAVAPKLRSALRAARKGKGAHTLVVHEGRCVFGVFLWPRKPDQSDDMRRALDEVRAHCTCTPLVMYTGARA